jgi:DHA2 family multidrug resistance protein-like MFS transporter
LSACLALSAASLAVLAFLPGAGLVEQTVLGLAGLGLGGAMTAASTSIMLSAADHQSGMAASLEDLAYELGSVGGVTVLGCVLSVVYALAAPAELGDSLDSALRLGAGAAPMLNQAFAGFLRGYDLAVMVAVALVLAPLGLAVRRL